MPQLFKSLYFPNYGSDPGPKRINLAFGDRDHDLYEVTEHRSSEEMRQLLGTESFSALKSYANQRHLSLNKACMLLIRDGLSRAESTYGQGYLFKDPLIGTYRGGDGGIFHDWYPLLEGFSPSFVRTVIERFAPSASVVLDPFGGTGTAPLTVASLGRTGLYCELNPVLQYVTSTKLQALSLKSSDKRKLVDAIRGESLAVPFRLESFEPDPNLYITYMSAFKGSRFFSQDVLHNVLQLRSYADALDATWPLLGRVFTVAVLASLVPSSLMKRAGDLRYKTERELRTQVASMGESVSARLDEMASDVERADGLHGNVLLATEDVRSLRKLPSLGLEAVVTSPPYLNGTNYVRNVKIEMWFLRALKRSSDLANWRMKAVTGGINDVTKAKYTQEQPDEVLELVNRVSRNAYDSRIPMMIGTYFADMKQVLRVLAEHLKPGSTVAIDIGDSRYGGVHVQTDTLLAEIGGGLGFRLASSHPLRFRRSRDGQLLSQRLLVFEFDKRSSMRGCESRHLSESMNHKWSAFKQKLPHQQLPYRKRNWGHPLHSLCSYEGKMKPSLAHFLVDTFVPHGGTMLDPFAGVGTIPFEACIQGKGAFGIELSPAAYSVARAKLQRPEPRNVGRVLSSLEDFLDRNVPSADEIEATKLINYNKTLDQYYHVDTLKEILSARKYFQVPVHQTDEHNFVLACLLHILHGNRPYALSRNSHSITPFAPTGPSEFRPLIQRLTAKVERSLYLEPLEGVGSGQMFFQDAASWWPHQVDNLDAVVTSPPFFDSTRFYLGNWIRLWFCGWEKDDFASKSLHFLDFRQKQTMRAYEDILRQSRERLKPGGVLVLHLGKSSKADMALELSKTAKTWFRVCDVFEESVTHVESHGQSDKGRVTGHQLMVLT